MDTLPRIDGRMSPGRGDVSLVVACWLLKSLINNAADKVAECAEAGELMECLSEDT
jgi:hypothetical protein